MTPRVPRGVIVVDGSTIGPDQSSGRVGIGMFKYDSTNDKLWVDWAELVTSISAADESEVLVAGEAVPGGNHNESP